MSCNHLAPSKKLFIIDIDSLEMEVYNIAD